MHTHSTTWAEEEFKLWGLGEESTQLHLMVFEVFLQLCVCVCVLGDLGDIGRGTQEKGKE